MVLREDLEGFLGIPVSSRILPDPDIRSATQG
jgi:hypothetical protein